MDLSRQRERPDCVLKLRLIYFLFVVYLGGRFSRSGFQGVPPWIENYTVWAVGSFALQIVLTDVS